MSRTPLQAALLLARALNCNLIPTTIDREPLVSYAGLGLPGAPRLLRETLERWRDDEAAELRRGRERTAWALLPGSNRIAVLGADSPEWTATLLSRQPTPLVVRSPTPGRAHLYYRWPDGVDLSSKCNVAGVDTYDLKARGATIHAPGSLHRSRRGRYACSLPDDALAASEPGALRDQLPVLDLALVEDDKRLVAKPRTFERVELCCLSSTNAEKFDEWEDHPLFIADLIRMLDNVLTFFIANAGALKDEDLQQLREDVAQFVESLQLQLDADARGKLEQSMVEREAQKYRNGMRRAVYSASQERSVGLGLMGFHSYLQSKMLPFDDFQATLANRRIFSHLQRKSLEATRQLAVERGECPDARGTGVRNMHRLAVAPNGTSSIICNGTSPSTEPFRANAFSHKTQSGTWLVKNRHLAAVLEGYGMNSDEIWSHIITNRGSVQDLAFLSEVERAVFRTAMEIDQMWIIEHAAHRTPFICQGSSNNLFMPADVEVSYLHHVHFQAWKKGLKSLYYLRSEAIRRADAVSRKVSRADIAAGEPVCLSCEG